MTNASATSRKVRGRPFQKGNSGRPRGSKNKTTAAIEALLEGQAEAITAKIVELALAGDRAAMRLCFEQLLPARPTRSLSLELPPIASATDAAAAIAAIIAAVAAGDITPGEAEVLSRIVESAARAFDTRDFEARVARMERWAKELEGGK